MTGETEVLDGDVIEEETGAPVAHEFVEAHEQAVALREQALPATHAIPGSGEFTAIMRVADQLSRSQIVPVAYRGKPDDIVAAILFGRELGIGPMQSLKDISVIDGKPAMSAQLMLAMMRKGGIVVLESEATAARAWIKARRSDTGEVTEVEWTIGEADLVQTKENGRSVTLAETRRYKQYGADMLWARCVGRLARRLAPDLLAGMSYAAEEITDFSDEPDEYTFDRGGVVHAERYAGRPRPVPQSWAEWLDRFATLLGGNPGEPGVFQADAREWLRQAVAAVYGVETLTELSREQMKDASRRAAAALLQLEEQGDLSLAFGVRGKIQAAFAAGLDGIELAGPEWALDPDELKAGRPARQDAPSGEPDPGRGNHPPGGPEAVSGAPVAPETGLEPGDETEPGSAGPLVPEIREAVEQGRKAREQAESGE